jgi:hypothetical protein
MLGVVLMGEMDGKPGTVAEFGIFSNDNTNISLSYSPGFDFGLGNGPFGADLEIVGDREASRRVGILAHLCAKSTTAGGQECPPYQS